MSLQQWERTVNDRYPDLGLLRKSIWRGTASRPPRSYLWKVLLLYGTFDTKSWAASQERDHRRYHALREKYRQGLEELQEMMASESSSSLSLSTDDTATPEGRDEASRTLSRSTSTATFADPLSSTDLFLGDVEQESDLKDTILRDVERTFPDEPFFRKKSTQEKLARVLYIYARLNPELGYRQGMHEIAGPVLYVMEEEEKSNPSSPMKKSTTALKKPKDNDYVSSGDDDGNDDASTKYLESDTLAVFESIMRYASAWYMPGSPPPIVEKCVGIQEEILKVVDPELYRVLVHNNIEPQIWGIRWIRLIFGREFGFKGLLYMWDAVFAADSTLKLVDYICVVILLSVRKQILESPHYTDILTLLLSCPLPHRQVDLETSKYVSRALYIKAHMTEEGGKFVAEKFENADSNGDEDIIPRRSIDDSSRMGNKVIGFEALESLKGAAKSVDKKMREALDRVAVKAKAEASTISSSAYNPLNHSSARSSTDSTLSASHSDTFLPTAASSIQRNAQLAQLVAEVMDTMDRGTAAYDKLSHVKDCLLDERLGVDAGLMSSMVSSEPSITAAAAKKQQPEERKLRRSLLANSDFSWMLDSLDVKKNGFKKKSKEYELS